MSQPKRCRKGEMVGGREGGQSGELEENSSTFERSFSFAGVLRPQQAQMSTFTPPRTKLNTADRI